MSELVNQVADQVGLDPAVAEKAVGMMLAFLAKEGDGTAVGKMISAIPGAQDLADAQSGGGGGLLSGLMGSFGGGIMALGQQLMGLGLGMGEITSLAKATIDVARTHAGDDVVDNVVASVPGLSQFV